MLTTDLSLTSLRRDAGREKVKDVKTPHGSPVIKIEKIPATVVGASTFLRHIQTLHNLAVSVKFLTKICSHGGKWGPSDNHECIGNTTNSVSKLGPLQ
jgi:hypothetical protein